MDARFKSTTNTTEDFDWSYANEPLIFTISLPPTAEDDPDLFGALGQTFITVNAHVTVTRTQYAVQSVKLTGSIEDLADYDYDGRSFTNPLTGSVYPLSKSAATIQSGYNTLGNGGRIFKIEIQFSSSSVLNFQFNFQ